METRRDWTALQAIRIRSRRQSLECGQSTSGGKSGICRGASLRAPQSRSRVDENRCDHQPAEPARSRQLVRSPRHDVITHVMTPSTTHSGIENSATMRRPCRKPGRLLGNIKQLVYA